MAINIRLRTARVAYLRTTALPYGMPSAAKFLGVSRATLWRMTKAGQLAKVEVLPGSFRVRRADLQAIAAGMAMSK